MKGVPAKKGRTEVKILDKSNLHQSSSLSWDVCHAEAEDHGGGGTAHQEADERVHGVEQGGEEADGGGGEQQQQQRDVADPRGEVEVPRRERENDLEARGGEVEEGARCQVPGLQVQAEEEELVSSVNFIKTQSSDQFDEQWEQQESSRGRTSGHSGKSWKSSTTEHL